MPRMSTLTTEQIASAADQLYQAEKQRQQRPALAFRYPTMTIEDAYAIQKNWIDRTVSEGDEVIGYKIGLTSRAMQQAMNIDEPDYGTLLRSMLLDNGSRISAHAFLDPRIEVELAFVLKAELGGMDVTLDDVLDATDYVVPALELIAARTHRVDPETGYTRTVVDTIADNAASAGVVVAENRIDPSGVDLRWVGAIVDRNGEIEETGLAGGVMGHPGHGIVWVCRRFARHGVRLRPNDLILSGSFTRPIAVKAGDSIAADYGPFGHIAISFC
jgi:2-oxo-hept-3-ene-1,7-dioate hydratase